MLDFGLAKLSPPSPTIRPRWHSNEGRRSRVGFWNRRLHVSRAGTGQPADARSDIFTLGAILYEMLSGKRPFHRDSGSTRMSAILKEEPPDLVIANQLVPPGLERIVRHCLEKDPAKRFQSARDLAFDLESALATRPVSGRSAWRRLARAHRFGGAICRLGGARDRGRSRGPRVSFATRGAGPRIRHGSSQVTTQPGVESQPDPVARRRDRRLRQHRSGNKDI